MKKKFQICNLGDTQPTAPQPQQNSNGIGAWCKEHWFLTFLMASAVIAIPVRIVSMTKTAKIAQAALAQQQQK